MENLNTIPTAEKILNRDYTSTKENAIKAMIEFAKLHVEQALKEASREAEAELNFVCMGGEFEDTPIYEPYIIKSSILNAYPLTLIK